MTKFKEAVKTALALVLVYGIALNLGWMNPYWAGWAVAMIALPTAGQSIQKGALRLAGTVPGCIMALVILGLAPQSRWVFMVLVCAWIFFTTYMMLRSKRISYFWNVAGFVCLIITLTGPGSSESLFEHAIFRTVETGMGVVVYTLVSVFLWPRNNLGAIKKAGNELMATQRELLRAGRDVMAGQGTNVEKLQELHTQEIQQLARFSQALQAEGSENYEVHELRDVWDRFHGLSAGLMETLDRWQAGFAELARIDGKAVLSNEQAFFQELDARLEEVQRVLDGDAPDREPRAVPLAIDPTALERLSALDRAALAVAKKELENLEGLTRSMLHCCRVLAGGPKDAKESESSTGTKRLPVPDVDHLLGAAFAATTVCVGFLVWIFINPPGHGGWFQFTGSLAMAVAGTQQLKATVFIKPLAVASALGLVVYVFIMPQLSTFFELGTLFFLCIFINCFFFSGLAQLAGTIAILNEISVQNQQVYNFAAMANAYVFTLMGFAFVFAMSYLLRSPRPEKAVLHLLGRFFRSAEVMLSQVAPEHAPGFLDRWKTDFYRQEMKTLPAKIGAWGKAINTSMFPGNTPEHVQRLVTSLQTLVYRIDMLLEAVDARREDEMGGDIEVWLRKMRATFETWSQSPEAGSDADVQEKLADWLDRLEARINAAIERSDREALSAEDGEIFFRLLGGFKGVTEAAAAFAGTAGTIDWIHWREEVFS